MSLGNCWLDEEHVPHYWQDGPDRYWCNGTGRDYGDEDSQREQDRRVESDEEYVR